MDQIFSGSTFISFSSPEPSVALELRSFVLLYPSLALGSSVPLESFSVLIDLPLPLVLGFRASDLVSRGSRWLPLALEPHSSAFDRA